MASSAGGAESIPDAWRQARQTLATLLRLGRTGDVSDPAGLGLARLLLGSNGPGELEEFLDRTSGPVLAYDALNTTPRSELDARAQRLIQQAPAPRQ